MPDYGKTYGVLCLAVLSALDALPETPENAGGRAILETALLTAEQMLKEDAGDRERSGR